MKTKILLLALVVIAVPAASFSADLFDNLSLDIRLGRRGPPPPPAVVIVAPDNDRQGPDQWEQRGHWYQKRQGYYYYPGDNVYYRPSDHLWFYLERGQWRSSRNLPEYVRVDFNRSVTLSMFTDRPYTFHQQVESRYPSNYFTARVRLRDDDRNADRKPDNGRNGRGNEKDRRENRDRDDRK